MEAESCLGAEEAASRVAPGEGNNRVREADISTSAGLDATLTKVIRHFEDRPLKGISRYHLDSG